MSEANQIERNVRPCAWLREQREAFEGRQTLDPLFVLGDFRPRNFLNGATYEPLYDQSALDAAVAAERERCHQWSEDESVAAAHAAGFSGTHWSMGPEELAHLLNMVHARPNAI